MADSGVLASLERVEVYQATGMIIAQLGVSAADALVRLRGYAFAEGLTASEAAWAIVDRRVVLDADEAWRRRSGPRRDGPEQPGPGTATSGSPTSPGRSSPARCPPAGSSTTRPPGAPGPGPSRTRGRVPAGEQDGGVVLQLFATEIRAVFAPLR